MAPRKKRTYTRATNPSDMNAKVAKAQVVDMLSNSTMPICTKAAASIKDGMRKAAIADAATFGYASKR